jgi:hypothetical protein
MDSRQNLIRDRSASICFAVMASLLVAPLTASAQVRVKKPDRGVYRSPRLTPATVEYFPSTQPQLPQPQQSNQGIAELVRDHETSVSPTGKRRKKLVEVELDVYGESDRPSNDEASEADGLKLDAGDEPNLLRVNHKDVVLVAPQHEPIIHGGTWTDGPVTDGPMIDGPVIDGPVIDGPVIDGPVIWEEGNVIHDATCDGCPSCVAGCDSIGCDSMGSCSAPWYHSWANSSLSCDSNHWFGGVELLLMFRKGEHLPPLVTTSVDPDPDADTAGEIGQAGTRVLVGVDSILKDLRAGGRLTLGTWIDHQQCRSLVMRGWFAGEETFGFGTNQDQTPVIARPFLDVSDNQAAAQDTQLIAFPDRATGSLSVQASNDVFGGDISVREFWYGKYGGTVEFLYGYQYMRMNENLGISSISTSLDDDFAPLGSVIAISDSFDIDNEFHGGQLGVSSRYREGCYSFNSLMKVAFGSLARRAKLAGSTFTSIDGLNAVDPNGLLVRSTNAGTITDHTFGWVPEIDLSLGWHKYPRFDVTVGYNVIAMTEALQVSGAIDPNLAVNLSDPPTGQQRPAAALRYGTYYVQGIHFGLQYVY